MTNASKRLAGTTSTLGLTTNSAPPARTTPTEVKKGVQVGVADPARTIAVVTASGLVAYVRLQFIQEQEVPRVERRLATAAIRVACSRLASIAWNREKGGVGWSEERMTRPHAGG